MESQIIGEFAKIFEQDFGSYRKQVLVLLEPRALEYVVRVMGKPEGHKFKVFEVAFPYTEKGKEEAVAYWRGVDAGRAWFLTGQTGESAGS